MKPLILFLFLTATAYTQVTLDSAQVSKLIIKLNHLQELIVTDSLNNIIITNQDKIISGYAIQVRNDSTMLADKTLTIGELRKEVGELRENKGFNWLQVTGITVGTSLFVAFITWLLSKE